MYTFDIPLLPMNRNQRDRAHWAKRNRELNDWVLVLPQNHQPQPEGERRRVTITFYKRAGVTSDPDNLVARCKVPLDALVKRGWIADDSPKWIELVAGEARAASTGTRIKIEKVS